MCELAKFMKPKKVFLQGGQSYVFKMSMSRPFQVTYARLLTGRQPSPGGGYDGTAFRKVSRGMILTAESIPVSAAAADPDINWAAGALDLAMVKSYEWVSPAMPTHYNDTVQNTTVVAAANIIQPQTGAINANAVTT